ncbi:MAG: T9SS type A sorting domain-containing protein [Ignavibacteria bacterium]|nr:T9SS type A sorting domain-containing protein [Ignavibacteria bacterium]
MKPRRTIFTSALLLVTIALAFYGFSTMETQNTAQEKYSQVKIFASSELDFRRLETAGLELDHVESFEDHVIAWLSATEIESLKRSGVAYQVTIDDWMQYYNALPKMTEAEMRASIEQSTDAYSVSHSVYGTMGGYMTYAEVVNKLDSMRIQYPGLISTKFSIGNTHENRQMWTVRVSNSPDAPTGRPEVWFHSLIHAREPMSMTQNMYFIYWLLENYNIDPLATYILRYRELYFTPVFNADGYVYNQTTTPGGGGMWRISRKPCTGGIGADLNRNYGPYAFWNFGGPGGPGSTTICGGETFRGDLPFDQIETQNALNFVNSRNFKGSLSYHTYGNYFIRPWGHSGVSTPDESIFQNFSADMALHNHFTVGRSLETVNYTVRGTTDDWYYSDSGHTKMISMTPEVGTGSDGFWPAQNRILPLAQSTVWSNIYFSLASGGYVSPVQTQLNKVSYSPGEAGSFKLHFKNKGLIDAQNVKIDLVSQSPHLNVSAATFSYNSIATFYQDSLSFNFNVLNTAPINNGLPILVRIKQNDTSIIHLQKIYICVGGGVTTLADSAENGMGNWTVSGGGWNVTNLQSYSPNNSFTESPGNNVNYPNSTNRMLTLTVARNISANPVTILTFYHKYAIDIMDNAYVDVSSDNGTTWSSAKYFYGIQSAWKQEVLDITDLANKSTTMKIRFTLVSNKNTVADGWYVDNVKISNYQDVLTGVTGIGEIPNRFSLNQNYPNPFNPSTTIKYQLPENSFVKLAIFDALGREIQTLVNENKPAGNYEISFDGLNLSSGIYFYKIEAGSFRDVKKMMLIK